MPLPNGVDPWGVIHPVCPRMMLMGNRGILHKDIGGPVIKRWQHQAWVACAPKYKAGDPTWKKRGELLPDKKRRLMATLSGYSELFFLDEATALTAGHRPCHTCRRGAYDEFIEKWRESHGLPAGAFVSAASLNAELHRDRVDLQAMNRKRTFLARLATLPQGTIFEKEGVAYLQWNGRAFRWSETGYSLQAIEPTPSEIVTVLTPNCIVEVLRAGYPVEVHSSVSAPIV